MNIVALIVSCVAGHLAPAVTLVGAYAVLGPIHYLTEISWLHDRRYFSPKPGLLVTAAAATACVVLMNTPLVGVLVMGIAGACLAAGLGLGGLAICLVMVGMAAISLLGIVAGWIWVLVLLALVPTLIHVFAMTGMFVLGGAVKSSSRVEWLAVALMLLASLSFLVVPCSDLSGGLFLDDAQGAFGHVFDALGVSRVGATGPLLGFAGFAYAYHYLNWFLKARSIGWSRMPRERLAVIVAIWGMIVVAYVLDFRLGFIVSLPLSLGHVLLEFPLNVSVGRRLVTSLMPMRNRLTSV